MSCAACVCGGVAVMAAVHSVIVVAMAVMAMGVVAVDVRAVTPL